MSPVDPGADPDLHDAWRDYQADLLRPTGVDDPDAVAEAIWLGDLVLIPAEDLAERRAERDRLAEALAVAREAPEEARRKAVVLVAAGITNAEMLERKHRSIAATATDALARIDAILEGTPE